MKDPAIVPARSPNWVKVKDRNHPRLPMGWSIRCHAGDAYRLEQRAIKPTGNACVVLGMGEAGCDFAGNLYHHHIDRFRDLVVVREVASTEDAAGRSPHWLKVANRSHPALQLLVFAAMRQPRWDEISGDSGTGHRFRNDMSTAGSYLYREAGRPRA